MSCEAYHVTASFAPLVAKYFTEVGYLARERARERDGRKDQDLCNVLCWLRLGDHLEHGLGARLPFQTLGFPVEQLHQRCPSLRCRRPLQTQAAAHPGVIATARCEQRRLGEDMGAQGARGGYQYLALQQMDAGAKTVVGERIREHNKDTSRSQGQDIDMDLPWQKRHWRAEA